ncbi:MAG: hypothetical protein KAS32_23945 [Candidatus Peribacteraceae bacterium]|nr:hypothetical protein [Candidatus Peribacteraceae bacterium]
MKMRKLILLGLLLPLSANAGMWEKLSTIGDEVIKPTSTYNVEASGWNLRVVEWIPKDNPHVRCMFAGGSKKGGVACYSTAQAWKIK